MAGNLKRCPKCGRLGIVKPSFDERGRVYLIMLHDLHETKRDMISLSNCLLLDATQPRRRRR